MLVSVGIHICYSIGYTFKETSEVRFSIFLGKKKKGQNLKMRKQKRESFLVMSMIFLTITITNIAREKKGQSYKSASNIYTKRKTYVVLH